MSTTIIDNLFAVGDALSGKFMRIIGGKREDTGNAQPMLVDHLGELNIVPGLAASDSLDRLRTSELVSLLDVKQVFDNAPLLMDTSLVGAGTAPYSANNAATNMTLTSANADSVVRQTKQYAPYQTGRSQFVLISAVMGALKANVRQRIGYFDASNGFFFQQDGTNLSVVRRTFTSGAAVDNAVNQSSWNLDKLDGTGSSGVTITTADIQTFIIDFAGFGGSIRMGVLFTDSSGATRPVYCHQFIIPNTLTLVSASTASLPLRWEITNTAAAASGTTMVQIGGAVYSEGGFDGHGVVVSQPTTASRAVGGTYPLLSVRLKAGFNRGSIFPLRYASVTSNGSVYQAQVVIGGTLTGAAFSNTTGSATEFDQSATAIAGGVAIATTFTSANGARATQDEIDNGLVAAADIAGTADIVSLVITTLATTPTIWGALTWREIY